MTNDVSTTVRPDLALVVVAAGRGERAGRQYGPKQYRMFGGKAVIAHTVDAFTDVIEDRNTVIVIHRDDHDLLEMSLPGAHDRFIIVEGGDSRQDSVYAGLIALKEIAPNHVLIHDAARPFVSTELLDSLFGALAKSNAVIPVLPVAETVKRFSEDGIIIESVARDDLGLAQTPQAFAFDAAMAVHAKAYAEKAVSFTDDASLFEWDGQAVTTTLGSADNIKITYPDDFRKALSLMKDHQSQTPSIPDIRAGHGYDVHVFGEGNHVTLCGVDIPHSRRLSGHSDADVCLHALTDALLATCGQGDIGDHFPPSDSQWKGVESHIFLSEAVRIVKAHGGTILNVDVTIIAEEPKIGPHKDIMRQKLGNIINISHLRCSVKATTNEKIGFLGRREGIAAIATASVYYGQMEIAP